MYMYPGHAPIHWTNSIAQIGTASCIRCLGITILSASAGATPRCCTLAQAIERAQSLNRSGRRASSSGNVLKPLRNHKRIHMKHMSACFTLASRKVIYTYTKNEEIYIYMNMYGAGE